jgi:hypothetical protein
MLRLICLCLMLAGPGLAETPNLSEAPQGAPGSAAQLVLAQRLHDLALAGGDPLPLITAIRLARGVTLRPATGWERTLSEAAPEAAPEAVEVPIPNPAGQSALIAARNLAGDDPDLQDLIYALDAQVPGEPDLTAVEVRATLAPGQADSWRLPLFGEVAAEIALIGSPAAALGLTVTDDTGATVCVLPAPTAAGLCRLTPARNGFFTASVQNQGPGDASYRLIGN